MPEVAIHNYRSKTHSIRVQFGSVLMEAIRLQFQRSTCQVEQELLITSMSEAIAAAIYGLIDDDLHPPLQQQITLVTEIARELNIDLPADVLRFKGASDVFASRYLRRFRLSRVSREAIDEAGGGAL